MLEKYNCPYEKFHTKDNNQFCPYCNNHGIRLKTDVNEEGFQTHLQITNTPCPTCKGVGYFPKKEEQIVKRLGKTRKIIKEFKITCDDCQGYKNVLKVIDFYECDYKTEDGEPCEKGKVPKWEEASYGIFEILFWIDIFFKKNTIKDKNSEDCPQCHGTSVIEEYRDIPPSKKGEDDER